MSSAILKSLQELVKEKVISEETAGAIRSYYENKATQGQSRMLVVFGILGALLVGLGIILILAHNWDDLSRTVKTVFAFLPLVIGQALCLFSLWKKPDSIVWREASSTFLFFAVGSSIALVSQIYNIPGNLSEFMMTWMFLCLLVIYIMRSSMTSLLYVAGITFFALESTFRYNEGVDYMYWLMLGLVLPYYFLLIKNKWESNFTWFHHWLLPASLVFSLATFTDREEEVMLMTYISLFGLFLAIAHLRLFRELPHIIRNGYRVIGTLGTLSLSFALSFDWYWEDLFREDFQGVAASPEFLFLVAISVIAIALTAFHYTKERLAPEKTEPMNLVFIVYLLLFAIGVKAPSVSVIFVNILVLFLGVFYIRKGASQDSLLKLNYGLLIIAVLVLCRFFDEELSFVVRGTLFVMVGIGFFVGNYMTIKKRKSAETK